MLNPRLAQRYAKSLVDIATEQNALDAIYDDMLGLKAIFAQSKDLVNMVKSPIIKADAKVAVFNQIFGGKLNNVTEKFIVLITNKNREYFLPQIVDAYIEQYKEMKNIRTVKLTTAAALTAEQQQAILSAVQKNIPNQTIDLQTIIDEKLIGGFVLESNNQMFDASIARDLKDIHKQFMENIYAPQISKYAPTF